MMMFVKGVEFRGKLLGKWAKEFSVRVKTYRIIVVGTIPRLFATLARSDNMRSRLLLLGSFERSHCQ